MAAAVPLRILVAGEQAKKRALCLLVSLMGFSEASSWPLRETGFWTQCWIFGLFILCKMPCAPINTKINPSANKALFMTNSYDQLFEKAQLMLG